MVDLTGPNALEELKKKPFVIKEGAKFRTKVVFQVQHEVLSGLKYVQVVKRKGIRISKDEEMLVRQKQHSAHIAQSSTESSLQGSYAPNTTDRPTYEKKCKSGPFSSKTPQVVRVELTGITY